MSFSLVYTQSLQDIQKMKDEYEKFQKSQSKTNISTEGISEDINPALGSPKKAQISRYKYLEDENIDKKYFGYNFFTIRDSVSFWENLPAPTDYRLGPGDELVISIWGETQLRKNYIISKEGKIYDEKVGLLNLSGYNVSSSEDYLKEQFGRIYSTLEGKTPSTYIDVSLGELRSINVNFVGQVKYPGVYPIHPFSTLITGLIQAGGVDTTGSLRKIQIERNGKELNLVDLYDYFIKGKLSSAIQLRDQDIVLIPPRTSNIKIDSAVTRPGIYESLNGETINDMITYAGGRSYNASNKVGIRRIKHADGNVNESFYEGLYVDFESTKLIPVGIADEITIIPIFSEIYEVELIGQVKAPGTYHFYNGMTVKDLLFLGGGLNDSTFVKSIYMSKAEIIRRQPENRYEKVIPIDLYKIFNDRDNNAPLLQNLDRIVVHANHNFFEKENILILGEVNVPGAYPIINDNESLRSVLNRAGGFTPNALENGIAIYRNKKFFGIDNQISPKKNIQEIQKLNNNLNSVNNNDPQNPNNKSIILNNYNKINFSEKNKVRVGWEDLSIALMPGDSIIVKEKTATIIVSGAVYNPGVLEFREGKSLTYYVNSAGGITDQANKKGIIVQYANGMVKPKKWYNNPKISEGSIIIVNHRSLGEEPFDITQFTTNWTSILSSLVTVAILSRQLGGT